MRIKSSECVIYNIIIYNSSNREKVFCTRSVSLTLFSDFCVFEPLNPKFIIFVNTWNFCRHRRRWIKIFRSFSRIISRQTFIFWPATPDYSYISGHVYIHYGHKFIVKETKQEIILYAVPAVNGALLTCCYLYYSHDYLPWNKIQHVIHVLRYRITPIHHCSWLQQFSLAN